MLVSYVSIPVLDKNGEVISYKRFSLDTMTEDSKKKNWVEWFKHLRM